MQLGVYRPTPNVLTNTPEEAATLDSIGDILKAGGTDVIIVPEIHRIKFEKNIWNAIFGPATVLAKSPLQSVFRPPQITAETPDFDPATMPHAKFGDLVVPAGSQHIAENTLPLIYEMLNEACAVGNALFPPTESGPVFTEDTAKGILQRTAAIASKPTSTERPSILVDVESGRPTEVEVLVGELVRLGRKLNVPIPVCFHIIFRRRDFDTNIFDSAWRHSTPCLSSHKVVCLARTVPEIRDTVRASIIRR